MPEPRRSEVSRTLDEADATPTERHPRENPSARTSESFAYFLLLLLFFFFFFFFFVTVVVFGVFFFFGLEVPSFSLDAFLLIFLLFFFKRSRNKTCLRIVTLVYEEYREYREQ